MALVTPDIDWIAAFWAYVYAVLFAQPILAWLTRTMRKARGKSKSELEAERTRSAQFFRAGLGITERTLYVTAFLLEAVVFIGAWLVFKVVSRWGDWSQHPGVFNGFAVGTLLSLSFAAGGAGLAYGMVHGHIDIQVVAALGPLLLTAIVWSLYADPWTFPRWLRRLPPLREPAWRSRLRWTRQLFDPNDPRTPHDATEEMLRSLKVLHAEGVLTDEEYANKKAGLLGRM